MLLAIAFLCFIVLMLAWLAMPDTTSTSPVKSTEPARMPEGEVSTARA